MDNRNCAIVMAGLTREARLGATIWLKPRPNGVVLFFVPRDEDDSMIMRRQAVRFCKPLANSFFLLWILTLFFTLPSVLANAGVAAGAPEGIGAGQFVSPDTMLMLVLLSAVTFVSWRYHRRDYASPRRIGRRI